MINIGLIGANEKYLSLFEELQDIDIFKISLIFDEKPSSRIIKFARENNIYLTDRLEDILSEQLKIKLLVDTIGNKDIVHKLIDIKPEHISIIDINMLGLLTESVKQKIQMEKRIVLLQKYETIGTLVSGISHEFNNILMIIMGYAQLAGAKASSSISTYISGIIDSCRRASKLIEQLSSFGRQDRIEKKKVNIVPLIKETVKLIKDTLPENIRIRLEISPDIHEVEADLANIRYVLLNLASNSQEAMPEGGKIFVKLFNAYLDEDFCKNYPFIPVGNYVCLSFKDTGIGIPKEFLNRIFDPFFTTKDLGRGLGLSSVYGIIKQHNGYIIVNSEQGKGTEFNIYLPAIVEEDKEEKKGDEFGGGRETILIVEDEEDLLNIASEFLNKLGYNVLKANRGEKALQYIKEKGNEVSLIITDLILPDAFGSRIVYTAKQKKPDIKTILITGYRNNIEDSVSDDLFDIIVYKPVSMAELATRIYKLMKK